jgi:hypothetical protein
VRRLSGTAQAPAAAATALLVVVAMVATGGHGHDGGHGNDELAAGAHAHGDGEDHGDDDHDHVPGESAAGAAGHDGDHEPSGLDAGTGADAHDDHDDHDRAAGTRRTGPGSTHDDHPSGTGGDHQHPPGTGGNHQHPPGTDPAPVPPRPYDGTLPVDLGGVPGVSAEQQAWAEGLVTATIQRLDRFATTDEAYAAGYRAIGDAFTGWEHWINWPLLEDGRQFDASAPESLVYRVVNGQRTLQAAMYLLEPGSTLDNAPDLAGPLIQYHIHNDLCWYGEENAWQVMLADPLPAPCFPGTHRRAVVPMVHVWIVGTPCGPFAALEGAGGGQVRPGEPVNCDTAHGHH